MAKPRRKRCEDCVFSERYTPEIEVCRRYPPAQPSIGSVDNFRFPLVRFDDWCGEYKEGST